MVELKRWRSFFFFFFFCLDMAHKHQVADTSSCCLVIAHLTSEHTHCCSTPVIKRESVLSVYLNRRHDKENSANFHRHLDTAKSREKM